jgi:putative ABC transport system permease protein
MTTTPEARPRTGRLGLAALWLIVTRSLRQHALSTSITVASAALASGLVMAVFTVHTATKRAFAGGRSDFDAILGAPGSPEQLVLNTLFHLDASPGNIPWAMYRELADDPRVERAVPYALGDNYRGYRIIGTTLDAFRGRALVPPGELFDPERRQAVVGAAVARATGLVRGSTFNPSHGLTYDPEDPKTHAERFVVTGVLAPTGTPDDRAIYIPIEGVYRMGGHELRGTGAAVKAEEFAQKEIPDEHKEVSSVLLRFSRKGINPGLQLNYQINVAGNVATLAWPIAQVLAGLHQKLFWAIEVLGIVAGMVVLVTAGSLLASLYNTMNERRHELAVLRALGARRRTVFAAVVGEASLIALAGALLGFLVYLGVLARIRGMVLESTGVLLEYGSLGAAHVWTPIGMLAVGALAGVLPAWKAYSTDVCRTLSAAGG